VRADLSIRRKDKKPYQPEVTKRTKRDEPKEEIDPSIVTEEDIKEPHLFMITTTAKSITNWRAIERKSKKTPPTKYAIADSVTEKDNCSYHH
jgi:hypothetical protein